MPGIGQQALLRGAARIPSVAAIVEQQHGHPELGQGGGEGRPERAVARVAIEDEHGCPAAGVRARGEPAVQSQPVRRLEDDVLGSRERGRHRRDVLEQGEVDEAALNEPEQRQHGRQRASPQPRDRQHVLLIEAAGSLSFTPHIGSRTVRLRSAESHFGLEMSTPDLHENA